MTTSNLKWWQSGIIYQIYPRSFQDSSGDGIGDLKGITSRLEYLASLGVAAIWLSPIFKSPMRDFGYDVADYCEVDPIFGTLDDLKELIDKAHALGLKIMLDYVPNHSSSDHAWFQSALTGESSPHRDWYVWRDPAEDGSPPNNWRSFFGGSAWSLESKSGQYYLHQFLPSQPDLNWRNPEVRQAMFEVLRFWMRLGIDGFRVDVIWLLAEDERFLDEPINTDTDRQVLGGQVEHGSLVHIYTQDQPETHEYIREMRSVIDEFDDRMMVGEIYLPVDQLLPYSGTPENPMVHLPFNFHLILLPWSADKIRDFVDDYDTKSLAAAAWPNWVLGNHDQHRFKSRLGASNYRLAQTLLLSLRGTPTVYYGDEIGMENVYIPQNLRVDPAGLQQPDSEAAGRDPERTPMQWDASSGGGFSSSSPWLPLAENYAELNVEAQERDQGSDLHYFRALTALRKSYPALTEGSYSSFDCGDCEVFGFERKSGKQLICVLLNFSSEEKQVTISGEVLISSAECKGGALKPYEARILLMQ